MPSPTPFDPPASSGKYIYHYTSAEVALTKIIPAGNLRAGSFLTMNDPRESKDWLFGMKYDREPDRESIGEEEARAASRIAQASTRVIALSTDIDSPHSGVNEAQFGRGYAHSAMWAHYGQSHAGVCLIFDRKKFMDAVSKALRAMGHSTRTGWLFFGLVEYADRDHRYNVASSPFLFSITGEKATLRKRVLQHVEEFREELFFRKGLDWSYEREFRCIVWDEGEHPLMLDFGDSLAGIVVGEDFGKLPNGEGPARVGYFDTLGGCCRRLKVPGRVIYWDNGVPLLAKFKARNLRPNTSTGN